jgi:hypothetical protein
MYIVIIKHFRPRSSIITILYARARGPSIELNYATSAPPPSLLTLRIQHLRELNSAKQLKLVLVYIIIHIILFATAALRRRLIMRNG